MMWSKAHRSEPNPTHLPSLFSPSSPHNQEAPFLSSRDTAITTCSAFLNTQHTTLLQQENCSRGLLSSVSAATNNDQAHTTNTNNNNMVRNPKKRSRASRRAPTTVLTTDTANFRAMVQEFTGIPAPPFTSSNSHFPRTRLDLFAPPHAAARPSPSTLLDPPYILRPFAQKLHQQQHPFPPSSSTSMMDTLLLASNNNNSTNNSTSINYPPLNFSNMHNNTNILSFQNILQQPPSTQNYPHANNSSSVNLASKTQQQPSLEIPQPSGGHLKIGVHHQNMVSSGNNDNLSSSTKAPSTMDQWAHKTSAVNYGKVQHYSSASSSDFHLENNLPESTATITTVAAAAARSEGMVESWNNCSSH
ncbi:hypothetical protein RIF29_42316 [Crotalaria pallida]|uniref:VQ domain-containing protein n=1 Tax=Crotalaria pallida TaxID=3830 RepID=A0AAN9E9L4_CROPI